MGIVLAAKHFAGTASPRRAAIKPPEKLPSGEGSRIDHDRVEVANIKRRLFSPDKPDCERLDNIDTSESMAEALSSDAIWCRDIWRSYGSREVVPPSPFGCLQSPSRALEEDCAPADPPVEEWSDSASDEPWGPDSPDKLLEVDSHPDIMPHWPLFKSKSGKDLKRGGSQWEERVSRWKRERTGSNAGRKPRRRHLLRWRRASRIRYSAAIAAGLRCCATPDMLCARSSCQPATGMSTPS